MFEEVRPKLGGNHQRACDETRRHDDVEWYPEPAVISANRARSVARMRAMEVRSVKLFS